jgi:hypothetical protein
VRKLRVSDGAVLWRVFVGGWPLVGGLDLSADGEWLSVGTKSLDTSVLRVSDGRLQWMMESQSGDSAFAPDGRHLATLGGQIYRAVDGTLAGLTTATGVTRFTPDGKYLLQLGRRFTLHDLGGKMLRDFGDTGIAPTASELPQWAHLTRDGRYAIVLARDMAGPSQTGIAIFERQAATGSVAPTIISQPLAQSVEQGSGTTLLTTASGPAPLAYQWRKNGVDLIGARSPALFLSTVMAGDAGNYACVVTNATGSTTSAVTALAVVAPSAANPPRLANLAVRTQVTPATPLIVGFVVGGGTGAVGNKPLLLRGAGPALTALGVPGALADPRLALFGTEGQIAGNDNWNGDAAVTALGAQLGAFPFVPATSRDAALAALPGPGSYTVQLTSADATSGVALAEIYDGSTAFSAAEPRLINVSARSDVGGPNGPLIAGFVIGGPAARTVLIRGIGPALGQFGVRGTLADPQLTVFREGVAVASNDNWYDAPNAVAVPDVATRVGAFRLGTTALDSALLLTLPPGPYTAQVIGAGEGQGGALVEVYEVP